MILCFIEIFLAGEYIGKAVMRLRVVWLNGKCSFQQRNGLIEVSLDALARRRGCSAH